MTKYLRKATKERGVYLPYNLRRYVYLSREGLVQEQEWGVPLHHHSGSRQQTNTWAGL